MSVAASTVSQSAGAQQQLERNMIFRTEQCANSAHDRSSKPAEQHAVFGRPPRHAAGPALGKNCCASSPLAFIRPCTHPLSLLALPSRPSHARVAPPARVKGCCRPEAMRRAGVALLLAACLCGQLALVSEAGGALGRAGLWDDPPSGAPAPSRCSPSFAALCGCCQPSGFAGWSHRRCRWPVNGRLLLAVGCRADRRPPPAAHQPPNRHATTPPEQAATPPQWATDIAALMGTNTKPASGDSSPNGVVLKTSTGTATGPK